jgi:hypothetical protein
MRLIMFRNIVILILLYSASALVMAAGHDRKCDLMVIARVTSIGEKPQGVSGRIAVYWIATYSIVEAFKNRPAKTEITVAHTVLTGNELTGVKVGDKILLCLNKCNKKLRDGICQRVDYNGQLLLVGCDASEKD